MLDKLPQRLRPKAQEALHEIIYADTREAAEDAMASLAAIETNGSFAVMEPRHTADDRRVPGLSQVT